MSAYYYRDGQLFTTKTMCNLVQTWQQECRVYPDEYWFDYLRPWRIDPSLPKPSDFKR